MQNEDIQTIKANFAIYWNTGVQKVTRARATNMSQEKWAKKVGRNIKTIQRFEAYKSHDPELMWLYKKYFL